MAKAKQKRKSPKPSAKWVPEKAIAKWKPNPVKRSEVLLKITESVIKNSKSESTGTATTRSRSVKIQPTRKVKSGKKPTEVTKKSRSVKTQPKQVNNEVVDVNVTGAGSTEPIQTGGKNTKKKGILDTTTNRSKVSFPTKVKSVKKPTKAAKKSRSVKTQPKQVDYEVIDVDVTGAGATEPAKTNRKNTKKKDVVDKTTEGSKVSIPIKSGKKPTEATKKSRSVKTQPKQVDNEVVDVNVTGAGATEPVKTNRKNTKKKDVVDKATEGTEGSKVSFPIKRGKKPTEATKKSRSVKTQPKQVDNEVVDVNVTGAGATEPVKTNRKNTKKKDVVDKATEGTEGNKVSIPIKVKSGKKPTEASKKSLSVKTQPKQVDNEVVDVNVTGAGATEAIKTKRKYTKKKDLLDTATNGSVEPVPTKRKYNRTKILSKIKKPANKASPFASPAKKSVSFSPHTESTSMKTSIKSLLKKEDAPSVALLPMLTETPEPAPIDNNSIIQRSNQVLKGNQVAIFSKDNRNSLVAQVPYNEYLGGKYPYDDSKHQIVIMLDKKQQECYNSDNSWALVKSAIMQNHKIMQINRNMTKYNNSLYSDNSKMSAVIQLLYKNQTKDRLETTELRRELVTLQEKQSVDSRRTAAIWQELDKRTLEAEVHYRVKDQQYLLRKSFQDKSEKIKSEADEKCKKLERELLSLSKENSHLVKKHDKLKESMEKQISSLSEKLKCKTKGDIASNKKAKYRGTLLATHAYFEKVLGKAYGAGSEEANLHRARYMALIRSLMKFDPQYEPSSVSIQCRDALQEIFDKLDHDSPVVSDQAGEAWLNLFRRTNHTHAAYDENMDCAALVRSVPSSEETNNSSQNIFNTHDRIDDSESEADVHVMSDHSSSEKEDVDDKVVSNKPTLIPSENVSRCPSVTPVNDANDHISSKEYSYEDQDEVEVVAYKHNLESGDDDCLIVSTVSTVIPLQTYTPSRCEPTESRTYSSESEVEVIKHVNYAMDNNDSLQQYATSDDTNDDEYAPSDTTCQETFSNAEEILDGVEYYHKKLKSPIPTPMLKQNDESNQCEKLVNGGETDRSQSQSNTNDTYIFDEKNVIGESVISHDNNISSLHTNENVIAEPNLSDLSENEEVLVDQNVQIHLADTQEVIIETKTEISEKLCDSPKENVIESTAQLEKMAEETKNQLAEVMESHVVQQDAAEISEEVRYISLKSTPMESRGRKDEKGRCQSLRSKINATHTEIKAVDKFEPCQRKKLEKHIQAKTSEKLVLKTSPGTKRSKTLTSSSSEADESDFDEKKKTKKAYKLSPSLEAALFGKAGEKEKPLLKPDPEAGMFQPQSKQRISRVQDCKVTKSGQVGLAASAAPKFNVTLQNNKPAAGMEFVKPTQKASKKQGAKRNIKATSPPPSKKNKTTEAEQQETVATPATAIPSLPQSGFTPDIMSTLCSMVMQQMMQTFGSGMASGFNPTAATMGAPSAQQMPILAPQQPAQLTSYPMPMVPQPTLAPAPVPGLFSPPPSGLQSGESQSSTPESTSPTVSASTATSQKSSGKKAIPRKKTVRPRKKPKFQIKIPSAPRRKSESSNDESKPSENSIETLEQQSPENPELPRSGGLRGGKEFSIFRVEVPSLEEGFKRIEESKNKEWKDYLTLGVVSAATKIDSPTKGVKSSSADSGILEDDLFISESSSDENEMEPEEIECPKSPVPERFEEQPINKWSCIHPGMAAQVRASSILLINTLLGKSKLDLSEYLTGQKQLNLLDDTDTTLPPDVGIAKAIYQYIFEDTEVIETGNDRELPMSETAQRILTIIQIFAKLDQFKTLPSLTLEYFTTQIIPSRQYEFRESESNANLTKLGRFYGALSRKFDLVSEIKQMIFDILYWKPPHAFALTYGILCLNSEMFSGLPFDKHGLVDRSTLFALLSPPQFNDAKYFPHVQSLLKQSLEIVSPELTYEQFVDSLLEEIKELEEDTVLKKSSKAVSMLCLQAKWDWFEDFIKKRLILWVEDWRGSKITDAVLASFLKVIGDVSHDSIIHVDVSKFLDVVSVLKSINEDLMGPVLKEAIATTYAKVEQKIVKVNTLKPTSWFYERRYAIIKRKGKKKKKNKQTIQKNKQKIQKKRELLERQQEMVKAAVELFGSE